MDGTPETIRLRRLMYSYPVRLCLYAGGVAIAFQLIYVAALRLGPAVVGEENGPIENTQVVCALLGAAGLFTAAWLNLTGRAALIGCGALVTYAAAREADKYLEAMFFDDAYKYLVGGPIAVLVLTALFAQRHRVIADSFYLMRQPAATLFAVAGIFLCFACQMLDRPALWNGIDQTAEGMAVKAMVEESMELFAYLLISFSGVEAVIFAHRETSPAAASPKTEHDTTQSRIRIAA